jgi:protoheme IX farnesyltransferase
MMPILIADTSEIEDNPSKLGSPSDYFKLMKPRVMSLVVFTAFVGYFTAVPIESYKLNPLLALIGIFAIALGAGASGVLNQWYDRDIDKLMDRTKDRPIPSGKIQPSEALSFGIIMSILSIIILGLSINWLAASLLAFTIFFYAVVYTIWLKRYTVQNIVIGGAAGAFPPIIGHICATGSIGLEALILFLIIFLWTPPHFWALALLNKSDYRVAKIPMLPIIYGDMTTRKNIFIYSFLLIPCAYLPWILNYSGNFYVIVVTLLNIEFIRRSISVLKENKDSEKGLFLYSIFYLSILFASICLDKFIINFMIG